MNTELKLIREEILKNPGIETKETGRYFNEYVKYKKMYGEKTILLYQLGDFYEVLGFDIELGDDKITVGPVYAAADILDTAVGREHGGDLPCSINNCHLTGGRRSYASICRTRLTQQGIKITSGQAAS